MPSDSVEDLIREFLARQAFKASKKELVGEIIKQFGGVQAIARMVYDEYHSSQPGSNQRSNLARSIVNWVMEVDGLAGDSSESVSREQLEKVIKHLFSKTSRHVVDAQPGKKEMD